MRAPPCPEWYRAVVMGETRAQGPVYMFVNKKCPEKARRAQSGQDVPGRREGQKNCRARKQAQLAPSMPSAGHRDERDNGARGEKQADQRAGQDSGGA